jgi:hypothetical protein
MVEVLVTMAVLRDGYWAGTYAQHGDVIQVPEALVDTLELHGFAVRQARSEPVSAERRGPRKDRPYGR